MMPERNDFDKALQPINPDYMSLARKARESKAVPFGQIRGSKREVRERLAADWQFWTPEQRMAQIEARGVDSIMDLLGGAE